MSPRPPRWIDKFLAWYCNPDLLEEIQGDALELYHLRLHEKGKASADRWYLWDAIRFMRWSNVKRNNNDFRPGYFDLLFNLNFKIASRNAMRNKVVFTVKVLGLAVCLAFTLSLAAFVISEFTYDHHFDNHESIFRIGSRVEVNSVVTNYAVSPLPLSQALADEVPMVERGTRIMGTAKPLFTIADQTFQGRTFTADSNFLKIFSYQFIHGTNSALDEPSKVVLTETAAARFFGDKDPIGQVVDFRGTELEVTAVIADNSTRSHLQFDALISWDTYRRNDAWDNVNAYTYIKLKPLADISTLPESVSEVTTNYLKLVAAEYELKYIPIIQNICDIHLSDPLDEDFAERKKKSNLYILGAVIILFFVTGLTNYMNVTLAELTGNLRKFGILRIFGGVSAGHGKVAVTDLLISMVVVLPLVALFSGLFLSFASSKFSIVIDPAVWTHPVFALVSIAFFVTILISARINSYFIGNAAELIQSLKGESQRRAGGLPMRQILVAGQLSFSIVMIALIVIIVDQFNFIQETDKGFDERQTIVVNTPDFDYAGPTAFMEAAKKLNGVELVEGCSYVPGGHMETKEIFELEAGNGMRKMLVNYIHTGHDYIDLLKIELRKGRAFDPQRPTDLKGAYLINETAAKQFGWSDPLGKKINGPLEADGHAGEVIGVVRDFHYASLHNKIEPLIIFLRNEDWGIHFMYIKTSSLRPDGLLSALGEEYRNVFPESVMDWNYLDSRYMSLYSEDQQVMHVFQVGLVISILVSCLGVFSISALLLIRRTKEMGIRKIVGASRFQLFMLHLRTFLKFLAVAMVIACPLILMLSNRWLESFAYHISLHAGYFIIPGLITLAIVLTMSGYHATKSAMVNPVDILKQDG